MMIKKYAIEELCVTTNDGENISRIEINHDMYDEVSRELMAAETATVIHHDDLDGRGAAQVIAEAFHQTKFNFIEMDYQRRSSTESIDINTSMLIIVDYSIPVLEMASIMDKGIKIVWLDHHASVIKRINETSTVLKKYIENGMLYAVIDNGKSGALLAYDFGFEGTDDMLIKNIAILIDDYDRWILQYKDSQYLNSFMFNTAAYYPNSSVWKKLMSDREYFEQAIYAGKRFYDAQMEVNHTKYDMFHYAVEDFHGYRLGAIEAHGNSLLFDGHKDEYDLIATIRSLGNDEWAMTFYSDKVDVSKIAEMYGGGGHKGAAGARVKGERPF